MSSTGSVTVIRPIKVMALVCGCLGIILQIVCIASPSWLEAHNYRQGLWEECITDPLTEVTECSSNSDKEYIQACGALCIIALLVVVGGCVLTFLGLITSEMSKKNLFYRIAMILMFFAILCMVIALIVFPVMFMDEIAERSIEHDTADWFFAWGYGVAWGAVIFLLGAAILLLIDKETQTVYHKEYQYTNEADA